MKLKVIKDNEKGFTLVEIVIVVAILGILSSLAIGKYTETQKTVRKNADHVAATSIATAAGIAMSEKGNSIKSSITIGDLVSWGYLTNEPKPQSADGSFSLDTTNGNIVVLVGETKFYPYTKSN